MTNDLDRLKAALSAATPPIDGDAKARAMMLAEKSFAASQETAPATRPIHNRPEKPAGFVTGVFKMFAKTKLRPVLYATSSLAVIGLGVFLVLPMDQLKSPSMLEKSDKARSQTEAPVDRVIADQSRPETEQATVTGLVRQQSVANAPTLSVKVKRAQEMPAPMPMFEVEQDGIAANLVDTERFANADPSPLKITSESPVSTFSIDVDTASYAYIRSAINNGSLPRPDAVRIEEMVNYFPYDYAAPPKGEAPFATTVAVFQTPWNKDTKLVHIGIQGQRSAIDTRPPLDLVFLIDTSGSMQDRNKLPLLKQSLRLLLGRLGASDRVSIVTYAGSSGVVLEPTAASDQASILASLDRLEAGGSTAGQAGLQLAYAQAEKMHSDGRIGRILLATDGDFNVGISDTEALKKYVEQKRETGTYLSVLGFGRGNYNDALMQALAQNGNGTASYIDTLSEAQKVLVDQASGALFPIANDVKIQVEFNPSMIAEYRLIGYETRALAREDFNNDKVDAGDIGAGHTVTAIYEITPVGSPALKADPLRYQTPANSDPSVELGYLKLRYKAPGQSESRLIETPISDSTAAPDTEARFSAAVAGFGQLLRGDTKYLGDWTYQNAIALAVEAKGADPFGYRAEAVSLMRLAGSLAK